MNQPAPQAQQTQVAPPAEAKQQSGSAATVHVQLKVAHLQAVAVAVTLLALGVTLVCSASVIARIAGITLLVICPLFVLLLWRGMPLLADVPTTRRNLAELVTRPQLTVETEPIRVEATRAPVETVKPTGVVSAGQYRPPTAAQPVLDRRLFRGNGHSRPK